MLSILSYISTGLTGFSVLEAKEALEVIFSSCLERCFQRRRFNRPIKKEPSFAFKIF